MKRLLIVFFLLSANASIAQQKDGFSLSLQLQPEITRHWEDYAHVWSEKGTAVTFNAGIQAGVQYRFAGLFFAEAGLGYIPRRLNNTVYFFNQNVIPPPRQSPTQELVSFTNVSYRLLQFPLSAGIIFLKRKHFDLYATGGYTGQYLLSAYYGRRSQSKYAGAYRKSYWQGNNWLAGIGGDIRLIRKLCFISRISYTFNQTVKEDPYLFSQSRYEIPMTHTFLQASAGIKWSL